MKSNMYSTASMLRLNLVCSPSWIVFLYSYTDYQLFAEGTDCSGSSRYEGQVNSLDFCANLCRVTSEWFAFGNYNNQRCNGGIRRCKCSCKLDITNNECAEKFSSKEYNLYKFKDEGELSLLRVKYWYCRYSRIRKLKQISSTYEDWSNITAFCVFALNCIVIENLKRSLYYNSGFQLSCHVLLLII